MLGNTGIEVSELSFGTLILGKIQADLTIEEGGQAVKKASPLLTRTNASSADIAQRCVLNS